MPPADSEESKKGIDWIPVITLIAICPGLGALVGFLLDAVVTGVGIGLGFAVVVIAVNWRAEKTGEIERRASSPEPAPGGARTRNHIICFDGTWNEPDQRTNVYELYQRFDGTNEVVHPQFRQKERAEGNGPSQLVKYYAGVGVRRNVGRSLKLFGEGWRKGIFGGALGVGARSMARQAYFDLVRDYQPGDRFYLFGFSRGAAVARLVAGQLSSCGIPDRVVVDIQRSGVDAYEYAHGLTVEGPGRKGRGDVRFLGLWDTVAAFGVHLLGTDLFRGKDLCIAKSVQEVLHMVAIDERRQAFAPTLCEADGRVEEIWFAGTHGNVGGGWKTDRGLSDIALDSMLQKADQVGVVLGADAVSSVKGDVTGRLCSPGMGWIRRKNRSIRVQGDETARPRLHHSVQARIECDTPYTSGALHDLEDQVGKLDELMVKPDWETEEPFRQVTKP